MRYCRICNVELTSENTIPANIRIGIRLCKKCQYIITREYYKTPKGREKQKLYGKTYGKKKIIKNKENKLIVFNHYSNGHPTCICCGEDNINFLTMDHINGDGAKHRKEMGRGGGILNNWLIKNNFPKGFRILCMNCNWAIGQYGHCPHEDTNKTVLLERVSRKRSDTLDVNPTIPS